ncbi:MAG: ATP-grasp domain-containing protein [Gammaproteobacteria bacterium]|nr:ATP-grasp domain-containing protein [Gammaproteobacteria bacterium]
MFRTLLVANRGEIACRVMRTARRMGLVTVAVHSEADADAPHVRQAHRAVCIGAPPATESYLNIDALLAAAAKTDADAIHPGYGFLSENADFAAACEGAGRVFVGPSPEAIRAMGSKIEAKNRVAAAGTPVVPGYQGEDQSLPTLRAEAVRVGFPLLVKASAGGGGKGMRLARNEGELEGAVAAARREAASAFGDDTVLLERYLTAPKHIEVQLLADGHGNTLHLFERDCSVQRRHQKVIEEAPAPTVTDALRQTMGVAAIRAATAIHYRGAGTVEFIAEGGEFHFMEMNTRLQVEHPVTEMVVRVCQDGSETPIDLVEWQLRIAAGEALPFAQEELAIRGHAVEARVYAENPKRRFLPSSGQLARVAFAGGDGVRVDAGVETGSDVPVHYDPMLAKVIAHGDDRAQAIERLGQALADSELVGVEHNIAYLRRVLAHAGFRGGDYTTQLAEADAGDLVPSPSPLAPVIAAIVRLGAGDGEPWAATDAFRLNLPREQSFFVRQGRERLKVSLRFAASSIEATLCPAKGEPQTWRLDAICVAENAFEARVQHEDGTTGRLAAGLLRRGEDTFVTQSGDTERIAFASMDPGTFGTVGDPGGRIVAPMPGQIATVSVASGDRVQADQPLLTLEAMKMEHSIRAPAAGTVKEVLCKPGDRVEDGAELIVLDS